ncbi:MAG: hypothetical protein IPM45_18000 [Acidimicrobiales bacterium]|nr:hypothetical protein [Acidimicrobiales bacterium]
MARTAITVVDLTPNTVVADPAGTAIDATNHHVFTPADPTEEYVIRVVNTFDGAKTATIKAGDNPPADAAGQGDLAVACGDGDPTASVKWVGPLTSARFIQNDGTVNIDVAASMTGFITVFRVPRSA